MRTIVPSTFVFALIVNTSAQSRDQGFINLSFSIYVTNLYWRGDDELLDPLFQIAESRGDVIGDIGAFYADLLDRRGSVALSAMRKLPNKKQLLVCNLAKDDLRFDSPQRERVKALLRAANDSASIQCLAALGKN